MEEAEEGVEGVLSLGGRCRHIEVPVVDLQLNEKSPKEEWGLRINEAADGCQIFYTDGAGGLQWIWKKGQKDVEGWGTWQRCEMKRSRGSEEQLGERRRS